MQSRKEQRLRDAITSLKDEIPQLQKSLNSIKDEMRLIQDRQANIDQEVAQQNDQKKSLTKELEQLGALLAARQSEIRQIEFDMESDTRKLTDMENRLSQYVSDSNLAFGPEHERLSSLLTEELAELEQLKEIKIWSEANPKEMAQIVNGEKHSQMKDQLGNMLAENSLLEQQINDISRQIRCWKQRGRAMLRRKQEEEAEMKTRLIRCRHQVTEQRELVAAEREYLGNLESNTDQRDENDT